MKTDFKLLRVTCLIFSWLISSSIFVKAQIHGDNQYKPGTPVMTVEQITRDEKSWAAYLSQSGFNYLDDCIAFNEHTHRIIFKGKFLNQLITGKYLPVLLKASGQRQFMLHRLKPAQFATIGSVVKAYALPVYENYSRENKPIPKFSFTDLNNNIYTPANTRGKILVLKTWFIKCAACIAEMPEVNRMADIYKSRKDILFISLALDSPDKLKTFLRHQKFNYAVIPAQESYIEDGLRLYAYPTHLLINRAGIITLITNNVAVLRKALIKETANKI